MADNDLTFESTTDTPEQMREGLGLPAAEPVVAAPPVENASAAVDTTPVDVAGSEPGTDVVVAAAPAVEAPTAEPPTKPARAKDPVTGKFIASPKTDPVAEERAARTTAELERDALRRRVEELATAAPQRPAPAAVAPAVPAIDPETYRDPAIAARFESARTALGAEPKQEDFDDYNEYRKAERAYDRKLAAIDANESVAHQRAGEQAAHFQRAGQDAVRQQFATFAERQIATKARHADYAAVMEAGSKVPFRGRPYADDIQRAIVEMEDGPELVYYLAKNPAELDKIMAAPSAHLALAALGRVAVAATVSAGSSVAPTGATQSGPVTSVGVVAPARTPISRAPEPQGTVLGSGPSLVTTDLTKVTTQAEYNRIRNEQERNKRRR